MKRQQRASDQGLVIGFILSVAISVGGVFLYFSAGLAPVATADPPMPRRTQFSCRCEPYTSSPASCVTDFRAAVHGLCDNDVFKAATMIFPDHPASGLTGRQPTESVRDAVLQDQANRCPAMAG